MHFFFKFEAQHHKICANNPVCCHCITSGLPVESARVSVIFPIMGKMHSIKQEVSDVCFRLDAKTQGRHLSRAALTCAALLVTAKSAILSNKQSADCLL